jgi:hypothetical protein
MYRMGIGCVRSVSQTQTKRDHQKPCYNKETRETTIYKIKQRRKNEMEKKKRTVL